MAQPKVTVIIPALNEAERIATCVRALRAQDYPQELLEIIVADNGSSDATALRAQEAGALVVVEPLRNADAARNTAARRAEGDVLAFTDADCEPDPQWISQAVAALSNADLVAGHVQFTFPQRQPSSWQLYDALFNLQHGQSVALRKVAFTANLLVWRGIFLKLGGFAEDCQGGGDLHFTKSATARGYHLAFAKTAIVRHPARGGWELLRKAWRIGREKGASTKKDVSKGTPLHRGAALRKPHFIGMLPSSIWQRSRHQAIDLDLGSYFLVLACNIIYLSAGALGLIAGLIRRPPRPLTGSNQRVDSITTTP